MEHNKYNILAIDHGNHSIKTPYDTFISGLSSYGTVPRLADLYITYKGDYYTLNGDVPPYRKDKTLNEDLMVYTLFAAYREAKAGRLDLTKPIHLACGLPPMHYSLMKKNMASYFNQRDKVRLVANGEPGKELFFKTVRVYAQGAAAIAAASIEADMGLGMKPRYTNYPTYIIVDIGGGTTDVIYFKEGKIIPSQCASNEDFSIIRMENRIIDDIAAETGIRMKIHTVEDILLGRPSVYTSEDAPDFSKRILAIIKRAKKDCAQDIVTMINNVIPDAVTAPWIFEGAGTLLIQNELQSSNGKSPAMEFLCDQRLNAKGYFYARQRELATLGKI